MIERIRAREIGPVKEADIKFGDLTVFVGPQATGKSIILQLLKLLVDKPAIHETMRRFGLAQPGYTEKFLDLYFGEGMGRSGPMREAACSWAKKENRVDCQLTPVRAGPPIRRRCFTSPRSGS